MSTVTIRPAKREDQRALRTLWQGAAQLHAALHPGYFTGEIDEEMAYLPSRAPHRSRRSVAAGPEREILVAESETDGIVGAVDVRVYDTPKRASLTPARRAYIEEIMVDPRFRQQGVGRQLMEAAVTHGRSLGAGELLLTVWQGNSGAEAFFETLGYQSLNRVVELDLRGGQDEFKTR